MSLENQKEFIIKAVYWLLMAGLIYIGIKYALPMVSPFVVGFLVAYLLKPMIELVTKKTKLNRKAVSIIILMLFYGVVGTLCVLLGARLLISLKDIVFQLPDFYMMKIQPAFIQLFTNFGNLVEHVDPSLRSGMEAITDSISQSFSGLIGSLSTVVMEGITNAASSVPVFLVGFVFSIVASVFFTIDYHPIKAFFARQLSQKTRKMLHNIKINVIDTLLKYAKAYGMLMFVTFIELSIGFLILRLNKAIVIAFLISLVDVLPAIGTGGIVVPWILIEFIVGNTAFAFKLLILYLIVTTVRNLLEPKVVGEQIGLHPLLTLVCMFIGAQIFGIIGLLGLPVAITIFKKLNDEGTIHMIQ